MIIIKNKLAGTEQQALLSQAFKIRFWKRLFPLNIEIKNTSAGWLSEVSQ